MRGDAVSKVTVLCLAALGIVMLGGAASSQSAANSSGSSVPPAPSTQSSAQPSPQSAPGAASDTSAAQPPDDWPEGPGKAEIFRTCNTACHTPDMLMGHNQDAGAWSDTVFQMVQRGAQGSDEDFAAIVNYLAANFGPAPDKVNMNEATAMNLRNWLGMGEETADAIVTYRAEHGAFKSLDDVKKVPGVDANFLDAVKDRLIFPAAH
jgi:competence protein ComEA